MKKDFIERVIANGTVDTNNYRYCYKEYPDRMEIQRIEINKLDTTAALTDWETVYTVR